MSLQYSYADKAMVSSYKQETAFATAFPTYTALNYHTLQEFTLLISYDDEVRPEGMGAGTEFGGEQYVTRKDIRMTLTIDNLRPQDAGWLTAFALGSSTPTQDSGTKDAYDHLNVYASLSQLPSFTILATEAGEQNTYTGLVIASLVLSSDNAGYIQAVAEIVGSGWRTQDTQTYPATIDEQPLRSNDTRIWIETGATIDITAWAPTDGTATLVAGTPSLVLTSRVFGGWSVTWDNKLREAQGYQATANAATDNLCRGELLRGSQREATATLSGVSFESDEFEDFVLGTSNVSEHIALEINNWNEDGGTIDGTGTYYHQLALIFPRMTLAAIGGSGEDEGVKTRDLTLTMKNPTSADEGSAVPCIVHVQNLTTAFMA